LLCTTLLSGFAITAQAAGAAWLALSASAAVVGSAGFNTAHALAQTDAGSAAVDTQSSAAQRGEERAGIDALIDHLHDSLNITAEQEPLWHGVTEVMRENGKPSAGWRRNGRSTRKRRPHSMI